MSTFNEAAILDALQSFADRESAAYREASDKTAALPEPRKTLFFIDHLSKPVEAALKTDGPFKDGPGFMVARDNGLTGYHAQQAAVDLVKHVLGGATPQEALSKLRGLVGLHEAQGSGVMALCGVLVNAPIDLGPDVRLVSFDSLPDSRIKSVLEAHYYETPLGWPTRPTAALFCPYLVRPLLFPAKDPRSPEQQDPLP